MSETDDTDDLLLIPPDIFVTDNRNDDKSPVPYYTVFDGLITQVNSLEDRINLIECSSGMLDEKTGAGSTQSTPLKPPKGSQQQQTTSLPASPTVDKLKSRKKLLEEKRSGGDWNLERLNEIGAFIKSVKTIRDYHVELAEGDKGWSIDNRENMLKTFTWSPVEHVTVLDVEPYGDVQSFTVGETESSHSNGTQTDVVEKVVGVKDSVSKEGDKLNLGPPGELKAVKDLNFLSLNELWQQTECKLDLTYSLQKLEEERVRRMHCEQLISKLQSKILELQEKLAVAVQVDQSKDEVINKFKQTWPAITTRFQSLQKDKDQLEEEIVKMKQKREEEVNEATKKLAEYEAEIAQARANQQKFASLEKQCEEFRTQSESLELKMNSIVSNFNREFEKNKMYTELIAQKDAEIAQNKMLIVDARREIMQCKKAVEKSQVELDTIRKEGILLKQQLQEEKKKFAAVVEEKKKLQAEIERCKQLEKQQKEALDKEKQDLRNYYQEQVEKVVQGKLREFQADMDRVELLLKTECKERELSVARTAAKHIQQITDRHGLEVTLIEQKHKEEIRLCEIRIKQQEEQIRDLEEKYQTLQQRWNTMAQRLEGQLLETMKVFAAEQSTSQLKPLTNDEGKGDEPVKVPKESVQQVTVVRTEKQDDKELQTYIEMILDSCVNENAKNDAEGKGSVVIGAELEKVRIKEKRTSRKPWK